MDKQLSKQEIINKESAKFYKKFVVLALEQSTAEDFITNYQETIFKYIAKRLAEEGYWLADLATKKSIDDEWGLARQTAALRKWFL